MSVDRETIAVYDAKVADYAALVSDAPSNDLLQFIKALPPGGHVLDLGCGPAAASAYMRAAGLVPDPVDASAEMVALANRTYDIGARVGTFEDVTGEAVYDGVWASFSLLHAARADLPRYLAAIASALKPEGRFYIGMKVGQSTDRDAIGRRYTYVEVPELHDFLKSAGLIVLSTREGREKGLAGTEDPFVICQAVKHG